MSHERETRGGHGDTELTPAIVRVEDDETGGEPVAPEPHEEVVVDTQEGVTPGAAGEGVGGPAGNGSEDGIGATEADETAGAGVVADVISYFRDTPPVFERNPDPEFVQERFFEFDYLETYEEVERYWVTEPYAYVSILYDEEAREYRYHVVEPFLDTFEQYVRSDLLTLLRNSLMYLEVEEGEDREELFLRRVIELVERHAATVDVGSLHKVLYYLRRDFLNYGPIDPIMADRNIEDISCDGADVPVFVYHRGYRDLPTNVVFAERRLNSFTIQLAQRCGKSISISDPLIDASLPDGSRIQLTLGGDIASRGSNFTIRKFADIPYTPVDLVNWNTFGVEQMAYFWLAIENNKSLVFAGGTGSGKTTSMNAVSFFIPPVSKVVSIEDTREVDLPHENWVQSVTRASATADGRGEVSMYNLLQAALRQRPEYLLVGEIRTEQRVALTFFQAMGTGHTAYTTIHADSVETAISRLQNPPLSVPAQMIRDLDIVSIQKQTFIGDKRVRRNQVVAELDIYPDDPERIVVDEIFRWDAAEDAHERLVGSLGESVVLQEIAQERGWDETDLERQLEERIRVLEHLIENDITGYSDVSTTIHMYTKDPESVITAIESGEFDARAVGDGLTTPDVPSVADDYRTWEEVLGAAHADENGGAPLEAAAPDGNGGVEAGLETAAGTDDGDDSTRVVDPDPAAARAGPDDGFRFEGDEIEDEPRRGARAPGGRDGGGDVETTPGGGDVGDGESGGDTLATDDDGSEGGR
jgi:flagellar protein FlaI